MTAAAAAPVSGSAGDWETVVGLEVHAQVAVESKLFSGAACAFGAAPNAQVSLVDAAMPGMLPVLNDRVVDCAILAGLALGAEINRVSIFDRKNYFYPDLPQGYQISQYTRPIVGRGVVGVALPGGGSARWALPAFTWSRTPARASMTGARGRHWSISTAPACR